MRKAYIQEKTCIQRMRNAFQLEKENIEKEREAVNKKLMAKCKWRKDFYTEKDTMCEERKAFEM